MKIVIIRFSSLGDCILLCPFLDHLKRHGAENVTVVTKRSYVELFSAARGVDRVVAIEAGAGLRGLRQIIAACKEPDGAVIDAHNTLRSRLVVAGLGGAAARLQKYYWERLGLIMFKRPAPVRRITKRYSELGELLGFPPLTTAAGGIDVPAAVQTRMDAALGVDLEPIVVMAPGGRWPMKRWPAEKFAELARRTVNEHGHQIVLVGDREDTARAASVAAAGGEGVIDLTGRTTVLEAAAVMRHASAFVGNDSALMHLAEAVDVPVVAVFGPTVEAFGYYPSLPASKVIERDIACRPCSRNGARHCPKRTQECLRDIPVERVEEALADLMNARGRSKYVLN